MNKLNESNSRIFGLDLLRAIAILLVMYDHGRWYFQKEPSVFTTNLKLFNGVSIFFVLSGFLIGKILIKNFIEKDASFKTLFNFWKRRWFRTVPNYYLILFCLTAYYIIFKDFGLLGIKKYVWFVQNFSQPHPWFFPEAWSLSVEEWFYLLFPSLLLVGTVVSKKPKQTFIIVLTLFLLVPLFIRGYRFFNFTGEFQPSFFSNVFRKQVITRLDSIGYGVLASLFAYYNSKSWFKWRKVFLVLGIVCLLINRYRGAIFGSDNYNLFFYNFLFSLEAIGTLLFLPVLSNWRINGNLTISKIVTTTSLISYSMYLLNLSVFRSILINNGFESFGYTEFTFPYVSYGIFWLGTILTSYFMFVLFESPMTNYLRKRFSSSEK